MKQEDLIAVEILCNSYEVEMTFFTELEEYGLIEIIKQEHHNFIQQSHISDLEKIIRMRTDLNLNVNAISVVFELLNKISELEEELLKAKSKLDVYNKQNLL